MIGTDGEKMRETASEEERRKKKENRYSYISNIFSHITQYIYMTRFVNVLIQHQLCHLAFFFFKLKEETDSSLVSFGTNKQVRVKRGERKGGGSFQKFGQYTRHDSIRTLNHFIPPAIARLRGDKRNDFSLGNSFRLNCPLPPPTPLCPLGARIFPPLSTSQPNYRFGTGSGETGGGMTLTYFAHP